MSTIHHTAARPPVERSRKDVGDAFAHPRLAGGAALAAGGVCPFAGMTQNGVGASRGDPAP